MWLSLLFVAQSTATPEAEALPAAYRRLRREAAALHQSGDFETAKARLSAALELTGAHPLLTYNLACAEARLGAKDAAIAHLDTLARAGLVYAPQRDEDFGALAGDPAFVAAAQRFEANAAPRAKSVEVTRLAEADLLAESVAWDAQSRALFVSSVRKKKIVRIGADGKASDFIASGRDGLLGVFGLAIDGASRRLYACTNGAAPAADVKPEERERCGLFVFDLDTGSLVRRVWLPLGHCGDLALGERGTVYLSDDRAGALYELAPDRDAPVALLEPGTLSSPQGLVWLAREQRLFVADWTLGLFALDLATRALARVDAPADVCLVGIDGLAREGSRLFAIQNGVRPHRLIVLALDGAARAITAAEVIDASHPLFDEPTLGVVREKDFVYVASSHWGSYADDGAPLDGKDRSGPILLSVPLR